VNAGRPPDLTGYPDFFWFNCDETEETAQLVTDIVARRIPAKFGLDPRRDVQVLCPVHRGPAGAGNLNLLLQEALTPYREGAPERRYGGRVFRVGERVSEISVVVRGGGMPRRRGGLAPEGFGQVRQEMRLNVRPRVVQVDYLVRELVGL
jgi:hypothetical protein